MKQPAMRFHEGVCQYGAALGSLLIHVDQESKDNECPKKLLCGNWLCFRLMARAGGRGVAAAC